MILVERNPAWTKRYKININKPDHVARLHILRLFIGLELWSAEDRLSVPTLSNNSVYWSDSPTQQVRSVGPPTDMKPKSISLVSGPTTYLLTIYRIGILIGRWLPFDSNIIGQVNMANAWSVPPLIRRFIGGVCAFSSQLDLAKYRSPIIFIRPSLSSSD